VEAECFPSAEATTDGSEKKRPVKKEKKIGRNDPCPCGSGKNISIAAVRTNN
jgi:uncharacterized protein YecA (UPF0149 family)